MTKPVSVIRDLFALIDGIVGNPRRLPPLVIALTSENDAITRQFLADYGDRLSDSDGDPLVPNALGADDKLTDPPEGVSRDAELLDQLAGQLRASIPATAGNWKPLLFQTCLNVITADVVLTGTDTARRGKLRDHLYTEWEKQTWLSWIQRFNDRGGFPQHIVGTIANFILSGPNRWLFGRRLNRRRFRWFGGNVRNVTGLGGDFLAHALRVAPGGVEHDNESLRRRILVDALLRDIERFVKRKRFLPHRRRRRWTPLLSLDCTGNWGPDCFEVVQLLAELTTGKPKSPVLVLAAVKRDELAEITGPHDNSATRAIDRLKGFVNGSSTSLAHGQWAPVPLPSESRDPVTEAWLESHRKVTPVVPSPLLAWAPVVLTTVVALAAATLSTYTVLTSGCADTRFNEFDERVGLIEEDCQFEPVVQAAGFPDLRALEQQVADNNLAVDDMQDLAGDSRDYREVVFFAPLTRPDLPGRTVPANALWQLQGAVEAQRDLNELARLDASRVPIKLRLANSGDLFMNGTEVAATIAKRPTQGPGSLAAVIGISQSRKESLDAFDILRGIPVLGSSMYGNDMTAGNDNLFMISPPDDAFAEKMVAWVNENGYSQGLIVYDDSDTYFSKDLRDSLYEKFQGRVLLQDEELRELPSAGSKPLNTTVRELCEHAVKGRLPIFAGRGDQLRMLVAEGDQVPECRNNKITMLAGPGAIVDVASGNVSRYPWLDLTYTTLIDPASSAQETAANSDEATGYDALLAASGAINRAQAANGNNAGGVLFQLNQEDFSVNGRSGLVRFTPDERKDLSPDRVRIVPL